MRCGAWRRPFIHDWSGQSGSPFAQLFAWLPAYRVLMVWVYDQTGSLLVAMLMHAVLTSGMIILTPTALSGVALLTWLVALAAMLWVVVALVELANSRHIARQPLPRGVKG